MRAPTASEEAPDPRQTPTTASGGTSEIAIATPGTTSPTSRRVMAMAPANPVATAAARSVNVGDILPATCELVSTFVGLSRTWANTIPSTTTKIGEVDWAKKLVSDILARDGSSGGAHLARASIHLAIGSLTQARKDLAQLSPANSRSLAQPICRAVLETSIELVAANRSQALSALSATLSMAEPGRTIRPFLGYAEILRPASTRSAGASVISVISPGNCRTYSPRLNHRQHC